MRKPIFFGMATLACIALGTIPFLSAPIWIAHAGGEITGEIYTNSREALDRSYAAGFPLIEIDFEWTTDHKLVLLHDWTLHWPRLFGEVATRGSSEDFKRATMKSGLHQMDLEGLLEWLRDHPGPAIVTDIKSDNLKALALLRDRFPTFASRFIAQAYTTEEARAAAALGYSRVILTLYRNPNSDADVVRFARENRLFAVTLPLKRAILGTLPWRLRWLGIPVFTHPVNRRAEQWLTFWKGVSGYYTSSLGVLHFR